MKRQSLALIGSVAALALLLGGCGHSSATHHSMKNATPRTSQSSSRQSSRVWNQTKDRQLTNFMNKWAPTMGQSYEKYDGHHDLRTKSGMHYPSDFGQTTVNGEKASIGWAPTGKGSNDYNVVALYNYDRPGNAATHITYAFAFHDGKPIALVDTTTNGTANWKPTANQDVQRNFERIADGKKAVVKAQESGSQASESSVDDKTVGVMVSLLKAPDWFKEGVSGGDMSYGTANNGDFGKDVRGYSFITANGDPESYIYYKRNGDTVTIKQWTTTGDESVAEGHFETSTISLKQLEQDYYSNANKRTEVSGYVSKLKQYDY